MRLNSGAERRVAHVRLIDGATSFTSFTSVLADHNSFRGEVDQVWAAVGCKRAFGCGWVVYLLYEMYGSCHPCKRWSGRTEGVGMHEGGY